MAEKCGGAVNQLQECRDTERQALCKRCLGSVCTTPAARVSSGKERQCSDASRYEKCSVRYVHYLTSMINILDFMVSRFSFHPLTRTLREPRVTEKLRFIKTAEEKKYSHIQKFNLTFAGTSGLPLHNNGARLNDKTLDNGSAFKMEPQTPGAAPWRKHQTGVYRDLHGLCVLFPLMWHDVIFQHAIQSQRCQEARFISLAYWPLLLHWSLLLAACQKK